MLNGGLLDQNRILTDVCFIENRGFEVGFIQISAKLTFWGNFPFRSMQPQTHKNAPIKAFNGLKHVKQM